MTNIRYLVEATLRDVVIILHKSQVPTSIIASVRHCLARLATAVTEHTTVSHEAQQPDPNIFCRQIVYELADLVACSIAPDKKVADLEKANVDHRGQVSALEAKLRERETKQIAAEAQLERFQSAHRAALESLFKEIHILRRRNLATEDKISKVNSEAIFDYRTYLSSLLSDQEDTVMRLFSLQEETNKKTAQIERLHTALGAAEQRMCFALKEAAMSADSRVKEMAEHLRNAEKELSKAIGSAKGDMLSIRDQLVSAQEEHRKNMLLASEAVGTVTLSNSILQDLAIKVCDHLVALTDDEYAARRGMEVRDAKGAAAAAERKAQRLKLLQLQSHLGSGRNKQLVHAGKGNIKRMSSKTDMTGGGRAESLVEGEGEWRPMRSALTASELALLAPTLISEYRDYSRHELQEALVIKPEQDSEVMRKIKLILRQGPLSAKAVEAVVAARRLYFENATLRANARHMAQRVTELQISIQQHQQYSAALADELQAFGARLRDEKPQKEIVGSPTANIITPKLSIENSSSGLQSVPIPPPKPVGDLTLLSDAHELSRSTSAEGRVLLHKVFALAMAQSLREHHAYSANKGKQDRNGEAGLLEATDTNANGGTSELVASQNNSKGMDASQKSLHGSSISSSQRLGAYLAVPAESEPSANTSIVKAPSRKASSNGLLAAEREDTASLSSSTTSQQALSRQPARGGGLAPSSKKALVAQSSSSSSEAVTKRRINPVLPAVGLDFLSSESAPLLFTSDQLTAILRARERHMHLAHIRNRLVFGRVGGKIRTAKIAEAYAKEMGVWLRVAAARDEVGANVDLPWEIEGAPRIFNTPEPVNKQQQKKGAKGGDNDKPPPVSQHRRMASAEVIAEGAFKLQESQKDRDVSSREQAALLTLGMDENALEVFSLLSREHLARVRGHTFTPLKSMLAAHRKVADGSGGDPYAFGGGSSSTSSGAHGNMIGWSSMPLGGWRAFGGIGGSDGNSGDVSASPSAALKKFKSVVRFVSAATKWQSLTSRSSPAGEETGAQSPYNSPPSSKKQTDGGAAAAAESNTSYARTYGGKSKGMGVPSSLSPSSASSPLTRPGTSYNSSIKNAKNQEKEREIIRLGDPLHLVVNTEEPPERADLGPTTASSPPRTSTRGRSPRGGGSSLPQLAMAVVGETANSNVAEDSKAEAHEKDPINNSSSGKAKKPLSLIKELEASLLSAGLQMTVGTPRHAGATTSSSASNSKKAKRDLNGTAAAAGGDTSSGNVLADEASAILHMLFDAPNTDASNGDASGYHTKPYRFDGFSDNDNKGTTNTTSTGGSPSMRNAAKWYGHQGGNSATWEGWKEAEAQRILEVAAERKSEDAVDTARNHAALGGGANVDDGRASMSRHRLSPNKQLSAVRQQKQRLAADEREGNQSHAISSDANSHRRQPLTPDGRLPQDSISPGSMAPDWHNPLNFRTVFTDSHQLVASPTGEKAITSLLKDMTRCTGQSRRRNEKEEHSPSRPIDVPTALPSVSYANNAEVAYRAEGGINLSPLRLSGGLHSYLPPRDAGSPSDQPQLHIRSLEPAKLLTVPMPALPVTAIPTTGGIGDSAIREKSILLLTMTSLMAAQQKEEAERIYMQRHHQSERVVLNSGGEREEKSFWGSSEGLNAKNVNNSNASGGAASSSSSFETPASTCHRMARPPSSAVGGQASAGAGFPSQQRGSGNTSLHNAEEPIPTAADDANAEEWPRGTSGTGNRMDKSKGVTAAKINMAFGADLEREGALRPPQISSSVSSLRPTSSSSSAFSASAQQRPATAREAGVGEQGPRLKSNVPMSARGVRSTPSIGHKNEVPDGSLSSAARHVPSPPPATSQQTRFEASSKGGVLASSSLGSEAASRGTVCVGGDTRGLHRQGSDSAYIVGVPAFDSRPGSGRGVSRTPTLPNVNSSPSASRIGSATKAKAGTPPGDRVNKSIALLAPSSAAVAEASALSKGPSYAGINTGSKKM